jgi:epoxide hydrolase
VAGVLLSLSGSSGWNGQLFGDVINVEFALTNIATCWPTDISASTARLYYEHAHLDAPTEPATVWIGLASLDVTSIRRFVDRDHKNVVSWHGYVVGGHHAVHQAPDVLVADLRGFDGELLADSADA